MKIRTYRSEDSYALAKLFKETIQAINANDYSQAQIRAWGGQDIDLTAWNRRYSNTYTLIAEINNTIVGFGNIKGDGLLNMLYVHKDYQGAGIASALTAKLESYARSNNITTIQSDASITAKPFFLKRGFQCVAKQQVALNGSQLTNYKMIKHL